MTDVLTIGSSGDDVPALECESLEKHYGGIMAVQGLSFSVGTGEIFGLIGPNGAGKTTVIDMISGTTALGGGTVRIAGRTVRGTASRRANQFQMARTFQSPQVALDLSVAENVSIGLRSSSVSGVVGAARLLVRGIGRGGSSADRGHAARICHELGLTQPERLCGDLSFGERRLVEMARALASEPAVMLLDEPFAGADELSATRMVKATRRVAASGCGVIIVDHNVDLVVAISHRIGLMADGRMLTTDEPSALLRSGILADVYLGRR